MKNTCYRSGVALPCLLCLPGAEGETLAWVVLKGRATHLA